MVNIMPKIIDNPIKTGAKSKIYLLAYPEPITGYAIAQRLQPEHKHPSTARVYTNLKSMKEDGFIVQINSSADEGANWRPRQKLTYSRKN